jgi:glycolate oxidase
MVAELSSLLSPERVLSGEAVARAYDCDAYTVDRSKPTCVVLPTSTEEVAAIVRWCIAHNVPYTPRGAGTGLSGGAMPAMGGVVISTKKLNQILKIDAENRMLKAQAGIANKRISDAVVALGLHFAPDPSSQTVSTLGGNIAENSGGPHTLKYGVTTQHILSVTMVDTRGDIIEVGSKVPGAPGYDFLGLIVGGEGTLGVVTEAWVKLTPIPAAVRTALASFPTIRDATECVASIIASGVIPAALEMMDKGVLRAVTQAFKLTYPAKAEALLLIECDVVGSSGPLPVASMIRSAEGEGVGDLDSDLDEMESTVANLSISTPNWDLSAADFGPEGVVEQDIQTVIALCRKHRALSVDVAKDEAERTKLWTARKKGIGAMGRLAPSIVTHDGVIPRSKLPEMLDFVYAVADKYKVGVANIFHAGDGNLHPCFYFDDRDPKQVEAVIEAGEEITKRCVELGGSVSGEHGIGVEKSDLLHLMFNADDLRLQAMCKQIFNDGELCNPCKVLPNQKGCVEHKKRWRGVGW